MKKSLLFICLFLLSIGSIVVASDPVKHALIIAVGDYPKEGRWTKISSGNDIELINDALQSQGFKKSNINLLRDAEGTKSGIENALLELQSEVAPGDVVVIHFSGHGQQIKDNNTDEIDGYDESIIPYDAHRTFRKGVYEGEKHFRDDEFGTHLAAIANKLGDDGNILVILDACHSGTGTRGFALARGTQDKFHEPGYEPNTQATGGAESYLEQATTSRGDGATAPIVVLSGASAEQLNYEYRDDNGTSYGSLSFAFSKSLKNANKDYTYRALFEDIKQTMSGIAPHQTPQMEGAMDQKLFGGDVVEQKAFFTIDEWIDNKTAILKYGQLAGLNDGTVIGLYPPNTSNNEGIEPIVTGTIANSTMIESDLILDRPIASPKQTNHWLFIEKASFGNMQKTINIEDLKIDKDLHAAFLDKTKKTRTLLLTSDASADIFVEIENASRSIVATTADDQILCNVPTTNGTPQAIEKVLEAIKIFLRGNMIRGLEMNDPSIQVSFEIIPITVEKVGRYYQEASRINIEEKTRGGQLIFNEGDVFKLRITNSGTRSAYFQIIDITPNHDVEILVPGEGETANEYKIKAGESIELNNMFVFEAPYGNEMFKLVATKDPINLSSIITTQGTRGPATSTPNPLEVIVQNSYKQTRAGSLGAPPKSANISTKVFIINE